MSEQYLHPSDLRDSYILTRVLNEKMAETDVYDVPWCPLYSFNGRKVKLAVKMHEGAGLAPFKADNAGTLAVPAAGRIQEVYMDLALIAEKDTLESSTLIELQSIDDRVAQLAAEDVLSKTLRLQQRNVNRTRWLAYEAIKGSVGLAYGDVTLTVDFDLDGSGQNSDRFSSSHLPTQTSGLAGTDWDHQDASDDYDADIIADIYTCSKLIADDLGIDETETVMHVNSTTWRYIWQNQAIQAYLSDAAPRIAGKPTRPEVASIAEIADIVVDNSFYFTAGDVGTSTKTKLLADGYALFMPRGYQYRGTPILEMYDGLVARVVNGEIVIAQNPGMMAEMYVNEEQIAQNIRVQTARMPVINHAAGIVYAQVYS
ncbi:hypothetical protein D4Q85_00770 [bacterium]|nr:MAG: hypothetical protein D4Q85_00770 [bacterium]